MDDLYLRRVQHAQAADNYRVILKTDEREFEVGSIGVQTFTSTDTAWVWGIDTVIPMRANQTEGRGADLKDCQRKFKAAWTKLVSDDGWLTEFLNMKRKRL